MFILFLTSDVGTTLELLDGLGLDEYFTYGARWMSVYLY